MKSPTPVVIGRTKLVVTLGIAMLLANASALGAPKPGDGGGTAACAEGSSDWAGFPAYGYFVHKLVNRAWTYEVRVASRNGICSKRVGSVRAGKAENGSLASPSLNSFVMSWNDSSGLMLARFTLTDPANTTSSIPASVTTFRAGTTGGADLSPDGLQMVYRYFTGATYPNVQLLVADLADTTGGSDRIIQSHVYTDGRGVWWAPWGKVYYKDLVDGHRRLLAIDPYPTQDQTVPQTPEVVLRVPATGPLAIDTMFDFVGISGGYASQARRIVLEGYYTTSIKSGGTSGSWCVATYVVDPLAANPFVLGSLASPSPLIGFYPSWSGAGTVLMQATSTPRTGSSCTRISYVIERPVVEGSSTGIVGQVAGESPFALKTL